MCEVLQGVKVPVYTPTYHSITMGKHAKERRAAAMAKAAKQPVTETGKQAKKH